MRNGLFLFFRSLLFLSSKQNPGLGGNKLLCGHTEFEESGNGLGEAEVNESKSTNDKCFQRKDELLEP
jgi:hypothetical protein